MARKQYGVAASAAADLLRQADALALAGLAHSGANSDITNLNALAVASLPSYYLAPGPHLNSVPNGNFEYALAGWTPSATAPNTATADTTTKLSGQYSAKLFAANTTSPVNLIAPLAPFPELTSSTVYITYKSSVTNALNAIYCYINWYDASFTQLSSIAYQLNNGGASVAGTWTTAFANIVAPANARYASIILLTSGIIQTVNIDEVRLVRPQPMTPLKNYAINPAFQFAQEYGNAAQTGVAAARWPVDGVQWLQTQAALVTTQQQVSSNTPGGSPYRLRLTVTTGATATPAAGDQALFEQRLDGADVADLLQGTAGAKNFVVRFGFKGPAGTYGVRVNSSGNARTYVTSFTISAAQANLDTLQTFQIPADTAGTWLNTEGTLGLVVLIALVCGTTGQTSTLNTWTSTTTVIAPNTITNNLATVGAVVELFDFGIYAGSFVPDFMVPDPATEKPRCQRYFQSYPNGTGATPTTLLQTPGTVPAAGNMSFDYIFPVPMRATPTITLANTTLTNAGTPTVGAGGSDKSKVRFNVSITAGSTTGAQAVFTWKADARP